MIRNLQRIQIKFGADVPANLDLEPFLEIFGRWRNEKEHPAQWVDLADYAHMSRGPGIVLVGHHCNLSFDLTPPGPGILYSAKKGLSGSHAERIASAFQWGLELGKRLAAEKEFPAGIRVRPNAIEVRFHDRMETPNDAATDRELRPALRQVFDCLFGPDSYEMIPQNEPQEPYGFSVTSNTADSLDALLGRMTQTASR